MINNLDTQNNHNNRPYLRGDLKCQYCNLEGFSTRSSLLNHYKRCQSKMNAENVPTAIPPSSNKKRKITQTKNPADKNLQEVSKVLFNIRNTQGGMFFLILCFLIILIILSDDEHTKNKKIRSYLRTDEITELVPSFIETLKGKLELSKAEDLNELKNSRDTLYRSVPQVKYDACMNRCKKYLTDFTETELENEKKMLIYQLETLNYHIKHGNNKYSPNVNDAYVLEKLTDYQSRLTTPSLYADADMNAFYIRRQDSLSSTYNEDNDDDEDETQPPENTGIARY